MKPFPPVSVLVNFFARFFQGSLYDFVVLLGSFIISKKPCEENLVTRESMILSELDLN